jgi:cell division protease FtsH
MVTKWGMSDAIGPIALEGKDGDVMFGRGMDGRDYSNEMSKIIDDEINKLVLGGLETARKVLREKRDALDAIAQELLQKETLEQAEFNELMKKFGIEPKKLPEKAETKTK